MTAEILWNSSMILRLNNRQGQGKRSLEARADAFSRLKNAHENMKNLALKVAHNHIFSVMPTGPNLAQISIPVP